MTAAELASFRALLQAQAAAPPGADRSLFARMRARLTVVEGGARVPPPDAPSGPSRSAAHGWGAVEVCESGPAADPPPSHPPAFGRRETGALAASASVRRADARTAGSGAAERAVRLERRPLVETAPSTPDHLDDLRETEAARPRAPAAGVAAGWSRTRPPSAQRRLLGRLEAVLLAEREGLEARRAADAPATAPAT